LKLKKFMASILCLAMVLSTMSFTAFAATEVEWPGGDERVVIPEGMTANEFGKIYECPHYEWEKEAVGVYIGGIKVTESGYYNYASSGQKSVFGTLETASEDNYNVYVNLEEKTLTLNNLDMYMECGQLGWIEDAYTSYYPTRKHLITDGKTGVPGVLVITEGTYRKAGSGAGAQNWESTYYMAHGYNSDYEFAAIGVAIMDEANAWTVELEGQNNINVYSEFGMPYQNINGNNQDQDAGVYGVFAKGDLTVKGEGTVNINAESNWGNDGVHYHLYSASAAGLWARGNLTIEGGSITATSTTNDALNPMLENISFTKPNPLAAVGSSNVVTIEGGNVTAIDTTDFGAGIRGIAGVVIEDGTVVASNESDYAGSGIFSGQNAAAWPGTGVYSASGGSVEITGGDVTATAEASEALLAYINENMENSGDATDAFPGSGISVGSNYDSSAEFGITIAGGTVNATGTGAGISANNSSVVVSGGDVTAIAKETSYAGNGAIVADRGTVSVSAGSYNTTLPDSFIAEDSAIVDGTVMTEEDAVSSAWTARLGDGTYYTGEDGADKAIANANVDKYATGNNAVWLLSSSSASRSGLKLGDTLTIYVAEGAEYTGTLSGEKLIAKVEVGTPVTLDGTAVLDNGTSTVTTFTPYTYTMVVDPAYANIKVVRDSAEDQYFFEFGNDYESYTACYYMEHGDTVVLLNDIDLGTSSQTIRDFVTFDFNGHTITTNDRYYALYISTTETGTITFTDTSDAKNGGVVNTGTGSAISNSFNNVTLVFENGTYSTASTTKPVVKTKVGQINGGTFEGTIEGFKAYGGTFSVEPTTILADGYVVSRNANGYTVILDAAAAEGISIEYKDVTVTGTEGEKTYEIVVKANDDDMINELASVDLTFAFTKEPVANGAIDITVAPATDFTMTRYENSDRYMFNYNGVSAWEGTDNAISVGTIKVTGYGAYTIATSEADTNIVNATTVQDNLVDSYTAAGATDDDNLTGALIINTDSVADDGMVGEITDGEIAVPTRELTIKIDFPNAVNANVAVYQDMKVEITGNIDGVNKTVAYDLGETMVDGSYVVTEDKLVLNNAYTVTVSGAGYRTARYTVTMTDDKQLNFWNNVMDEAQVVEIGKDSSVAKVTFLAGDIVKDNNINIYDLSAVVSYFGTETNTAAYDAYAKYDLNRDGVIDSKDVAYVLVSWNN